MKQSHSDFKLVSLLNPVYLYKRIKTIRSFRILKIRIFHLTIFIWELLFGRYCKKFQKRQTIIQRGRKYRDLGQYDMALNEFNHALEISPAKGQIHAEIAWTYEKKGDTEPALKELKKAISSGFDTKDIYVDIARIYREKGELDLALNELKSIIRVYPGEGQLHRELGLIYKEMGDTDSAVKELKYAVNLSFDNEEIHLDLSRLYCDDDHHSMAEQELKNVLKINPSNKEAHLELGKIYRQRKNYNLAIKEVAEAIRLGLDNEEIHLCLARIYHENNEYKLAIKEFKKMLKLNPENPALHFEIGKLYHTEKEYDLAVRELNEAIRLDLDNEEIHLYLGEIFQARREYDLAISEFKKAIEINPEDGELYASLGKAYEAVGKDDLAVEEFRKAVEKGCKHKIEMLKTTLSKIYYKKLNIKYENERKNELEKINEQKKKKYEQDVERVKQTIKNGSVTGEEHIKLGKLYRKTGKHDLVIKEFKKASQMRLCKEEPFFKNKLLNEIEIFHGKTILRSKPREMRISLTNKCNLKCKMCGASKGMPPWDISENIVREIMEYFPYLQEVYWSSAAGEAFLSKHFEELFEKASEYPRLFQQINTNGLLIDEKWAKKLVRNRVEITYSIDGATKKTYEHIRQGAKYEDLLKSINLVNEYKVKHNRDIQSVENKVRTNINCVVMKSNYHEMANMLDFAKEYKFDNLQFLPVEKILDNENIFFHQDLNAAEYIKKIRPKLLRKARDYRLQLNISLPEIEVDNPWRIEFTVENESDTDDVKFNNWKEDDLPETGYDETIKTENIHNIPHRVEKILCYLPWQSLFIGGDKNVRPHCLCPTNIGNIETKSLEEIWNGKIMQIYRKKLLSNCLDWCDYKCISGIVPEDLFELP